jgi:hypothetical protein
MVASPDPIVPRPPEKPDPQECCNRGCCPCIFDYYWDALDRWKATVEHMGFDPEAVLAARGRS